MELPVQPASPSADHVDDVPLRDVIREKIRTGIAEGTWRPGTRLVERDLAEDFGVSRVPVREALRALESEGFVELLPRRGAVVRVLTRSVVEDLFDIRQVLEVLAARLVAERIDDEGLAQLAASVEHGRRALDAGDHSWAGTANTAFHEDLLRLTGNDSLRAVLQPLTGRLRWLFRQTTDHERVQSEHEQLLAAIRMRDAELAAAVALAHVRASRHMVVDGMPGEASEP
ncbi:GntR family transcriptional regulator [Geodermatophilus chilensis]|uniref:GntR family transcriptional regulator n=1 Tax=Geodermatophilus chilensis TaxID=2035835 RepID=UPI0018E42B0C|nr:GntR family transcriptional regulator [Geodermatophilus chilensis]